MALRPHRGAVASGPKEMLLAHIHILASLFCLLGGPHAVAHAPTRAADSGAGLAENRPEFTAAEG